MMLVEYFTLGLTCGNESGLLPVKIDLLLLRCSKVRWHFSLIVPLWH